jgi:hypothetical protein
MKITVFATTRFEGFHRWQAAPPEVAFLRDLHRHEFHVKVYRQVSHTDRDTEFILLKRELGKVIGEMNRRGTEDWSCERWAVFLTGSLNLSKCEVSEDGENGAVVEV